MPPRIVTGSSASPITLSIAVVSSSGLIPHHLSGARARLVTNSSAIRTNDDVILFYGKGMARELMRFSVELEGMLPPLAVLAHSLDWGDVSLALEQGATTYLLENRYDFLLVEALLCTSRGAGFLDPVIAASLVRAFCRSSSVTLGMARSRIVPAIGLDHRSILSPRERQAMDLLASGMKVREVAQRMFLTEKSVRNYLSRIYRKLHVRGQSEAILCWLGCLEAPIPTRR
ncbi:LuxR C-terminal-related transcriptional regulator [Streptomyces sp. NPDC005811]|uniref:helix-turn-helix transcriptional regulator n=1 Tax=Streptomyces sp. NPDC005811 TaxID=3154565 RepID=UPI0033CBA582